MSKRVFLTGATGYVGSAILTQLIRSRFEVTCLVRPGSEKKLPFYPSDRVNFAYGDILKPDIWKRALQNCDSVIHLVGIIKEFPKQGITFDLLHTEATRFVLQAAAESGVKRFIHMSALGAKIGAASPYQHTKGLAEQLVQSSDLEWTIFRPSVIFGTQDEFVNRLADLVRKAPLAPVPGSGRFELQPVGLDNVAEGFVRSLSTPESIHQVYEVGGPRSYTYNRILDLIGEAIGKKKVRKIHIPIGLMRPIVSIGQMFSSFPLTEAQLLMLLDGNTCDPTLFYRTFDINPLPFSEGIRLYLTKS